MAMTGRLLLSIQSLVMEMIRLQLGTTVPDSARSNTFHILGLNRQLDIIIEQNHRLHALVQSLTSTATPAHKRLVTRIKRSLAGVDSPNTSVKWSVSPTLVSQVPHINTGEALIILTNIFSSSDDNTTESEDVTPTKRRMLSTPSPRPDVTE
jgi:hypothetical protein